MNTCGRQQRWCTRQGFQHNHPPPPVIHPTHHHTYTSSPRQSYKDPQHTHILPVNLDWIESAFTHVNVCTSGCQHVRMSGHVDVWLCGLGWAGWLGMYMYVCCGAGLGWHGAHGAGKEGSRGWEVPAGEPSCPGNLPVRGPSWWSHSQGWVSLPWSGWVQHKRHYGVVVWVYPPRVCGIPPGVS